MASKPKLANRALMAQWVLDRAEDIAAITKPDYYDNAAELFDKSDVRDLRKVAAELTKRCEWKSDEDGNWHTSCNEIYIIIEGTPTENSMRFCCYCGGAISEVSR